MSVLVTGGSGFLGSHLVDRLRAGGTESFIARHSEYDLTTAGDARRAFSDSSPDLVFHLAAEVGGIGANRTVQAVLVRKSDDGAHVLEQSRRAGVEKLVIVGTICAYPKLRRFRSAKEDLWNGYPEETNAPYGVAKRALLVGAQAYRDQYGLT